MAKRVTRVIYILITLALVNEMSTNVLARDNKRRKDKLGGFLKNICDVTDRYSKVHCYCQNSKEINNVTKAECWVFHGDIQQDDLIWQSFSSQPALETLSFNVRIDSSLGYVPTKALTYLQKLESIIIKYGNINDITPYAFANLTDLKIADLSQNGVQTLWQYAFAYLPNITTINLEDNQITQIEASAFYELPNLQKLILTQNNLTQLKNGTFQHLFKLIELDLNKNNILHLYRSTFDNLANLRRLDLKKNRIQNITQFTFAELWSLQELLLGKNDIRFISERAFDGLSQLQKLSLDDNKLTSLPSGLFEGVRGLSGLDLRLNKLCTLTFDNIKPILDNMKPLNSNLLLEDNKFLCDCRLSWIHRLWEDTRSDSTKTSLQKITCDIISTPHLDYNEIRQSLNNQIDYTQNILHTDLIIETVSDRSNYTKKIQDSTEKENFDEKEGKNFKRHLLKIPIEELPCLKDVETTETPTFIADPVIPIQNEIKTYRFYDIKSQGSNLCSSSFVITIYSVSFSFYFT